jgi:tetratricopeptide (TPR) repeat protein
MPEVPKKDLNMLTIFAPIEDKDRLLQIIQKEDRLEEVVNIEDIDSSVALMKLPYLTVLNDEILIPLPWDNSSPPYLLPPSVAFDEESLLGLIFHFLQNDQKSWQYLSTKSVYAYIEQQNRLKYGQAMTQLFPEKQDFLHTHNLAATYHYAYLEGQTAPISPENFYLEAVGLAEDGEHAAFSFRELASFYLDMNQMEKAEEMVNKGLEKAFSEDSTHALNLLLCRIWMAQLLIPYKDGQVDRLKNKIWETLTYHEKMGYKVQVGLLLLDATHLANISESYAEALGYIQRAIAIFEEEGMTELAASAQLQKGVLLGTWAQNGNPQFFKPAIESYQKALYSFPKDQTPDIFADIQHKLGVLYAEMPDEHKKRGIWAGVASSSFQAALDYYTRESHPYEYASICNNFANAYTKFPPALRSDNHGKALYYYQEALEIRTPEYPYERAISLLNYLRASWNTGNDPEYFNQVRFDDMKNKALEVRELVQDPSMLEEADKHLAALDQLESKMKKEGV